MIKLFLLILNARLYYLGGLKKSFWRDWLIPADLAIYFGFYFKNIWLGVLLFGSYQIIRLGCGAYDPEDTKNSLLGKITKDKDGWIVRFWCGFLTAAISSLPLFIYQSGNWYFQYILVNCVWGYIVCFRKLRNVILDPLLGIALTSIVYLIK